ncbi:MAG: cell division protein ZapE [Gammaproteobacteria bacterium]
MNQPLSSTPGTITPSERYALDLQHGALVSDASQAAAVEHLQRLYDDLLKAGPIRPGGRLGRWFQRRRELPKGLYFWGGVGRGKTYLMDTFYECLPFEDKLRIHFHRFMRRVHDDLATLDRQADPLKAIAGRIARRTRVLCLDEFIVIDIGDAMLLSGLLHGLVEEGVALVATSNTPPDELYRNGLQRARFLPAIDLLKRHTEVVNVDGGIDYRLRALERAEIYHFPLDEAADLSLRRTFEEVAPESGEEGVVLQIEGRPLKTALHADGVVWFEFDELCDGPRGTGDYIELSRCYQTVLLSRVPRLGEGSNDQARRFISLVDEFYDRNVKLVISAEVDVDELYSGTLLAAEFERTRSRLHEMQSHDYLARPHLA